MVYTLGKISNKRRFAIFSSYGYICQKCNEYSKGNICLHHIIPKKCGGGDYNLNVIPLCNQCHKIVHTFGYRGPLLKLYRRK